MAHEAEGGCPGGYLVNEEEEAVAKVEEDEEDSSCFTTIFYNETAIEGPLVVPLCQWNIRWAVVSGGDSIERLSRMCW